MATKPNGPVWVNKYGQPLRCALCGKPRMRSTPICESCKEKFHKTYKKESN